MQPIHWKIKPTPGQSHIWKDLYTGGSLACWVYFVFSNRNNSAINQQSCSLCNMCTKQQEVTNIQTWKAAELYVVKNEKKKYMK